MTTTLIFLYSLFIGFISYLVIINLYLGKQIKDILIYLCKINFFNKFAFYTSLVSIIIFFLYLFESRLSINFIESFNTGITYFSSEGGSGSNINVPLNNSSSITAATENNLNNLNINAPPVKISVPQNTIQVLATTAATATGLGAGVKFAQQMPTIAGKAAALIGTVGLAHAANITAQKINSSVNSSTSNTENNNNTDSTDSTSKYVQNYLEQPNNIKNSNQVNTESEFPMNLLPDLETYTNLELMFLFFILNSAISTVIMNKNIDFKKYLPNNKIGKFIEYFLLRYIKIWYTSNIFVFTLSWVCLLICILISKICLYYLI